MISALASLLARLESPRLEARLLVQHALGVNRGTLIANPDHAAAPQQVEAAKALAVRRAAGEPLAYLIGKREFYGADFAVGPGALIPRPETELLVEAVLERAGPETVFADLGAGSGAIGVTLARLMPDWRGLLVDDSPQALLWAGRNARLHGVEERLALVRADFTRPLVMSGGLDVVVSNPPYVAAHEHHGLQPEVRGHEPRQALVPRVDDGQRGDELYPLLAAWAQRALKPGGLLAVEMGAGQGESVAGALRAQGFVDVAVLQDLAGLDRVSLGRTL